MPEVSVASLDHRQQTLVDNARVALEKGDAEYALGATARVLSLAPGCLAVRRLQRVAQLRQAGNKNGFFAKMAGGISTLRLMTGSNEKDPAQQLALAEKFLAESPSSVPALKMLAEAAHGLGLLETVAFAFEAIREIEPHNRVNLLALGEAWLTAGKPAEALKIVDALLKMNPADAEAQALMRKASIAQTVTQGNWEAKGTFRGKLREGRARYP